LFWDTDKSVAEYIPHWMIDALPKDGVRENS
jgi:hypothetical protein